MSATEVPDATVETNPETPFSLELSQDPVGSAGQESARQRGPKGGRVRGHARDLLPDHFRGVRAAHETAAAAVRAPPGAAARAGTVRRMAVACSHLDTVELRELPAEVAGCEDCLRSGGKWVHRVHPAHLRRADPGR